MACTGKSVALASTELQIMLSLVRAKGETVRRATIENAAWGIADEVTPNALDVALHRIRKKLHGIDAALEIINVRGHGYALRPAPIPESGQNQGAFSAKWQHGDLTLKEERHESFCPGLH